MPAYSPARGDVTVAWRWPAWTRNPEIGFRPNGHTLTVDGQPFQEVTYSAYNRDPAAVRLALNVPPASQGVDPGHRAPTALAALATPPAGEVAPGVHIVRVQGFTMMFVEFGDFVAALEAPASDFPGLQSIPAERRQTSASAEYLAAIRTAVPAKPIRYVVVTHHHGDHMGGIRAFASAGATIVVAAGDREAAEAALARPHTVAPDAWHGDRKGKVEVVEETRVISDGTRRLELLNVIGNPHTRENLAVWLPRERILFQGDLFYASAGEPFPPLGRVVMNRFFARWLGGRRIEPLAIYGVHNSGVAGPAHVAAAARDERQPPSAHGRPGC